MREESNTVCVARLHPVEIETKMATDSSDLFSRRLVLDDDVISEDNEPLTEEDIERGQNGALSADKTNSDSNIMRKVGRRSSFHVSQSVKVRFLE